jgi:hypothetical protein
MGVEQDSKGAIKVGDFALIKHTLASVTPLLD